MKLSLNWLKDFVQIKLSPEQLAEKLTLAGFEVEKIVSLREISRREKRIRKDTVFDIEVTPNRGDCFSVLGLAREVAVIINSKLKIKNEKLMLRGSTSIGDQASIKLKIEEPRLCPRMYIASISGVKISPSPSWMQERLASMGVKAINNVVDITNYVMFELGQPLHAFDADKIADSADRADDAEIHINPPNPHKSAVIYVRKAKQGEKITTIDGKERELDSDVLVLADDNGPIDIAGIQGGIETEIKSETQNIILSVSQFNPTSIRLTSRKMRFQTESSIRFERGLDPSIAEKTFIQAVNFLEKFAGGKIEAMDYFEARKYKETKVEVYPEEIRAVLGVDKALISDLKIRQILTNLGFRINPLKSTVSAKPWQVIIPSWRQDVNIWQDLVEEIGRIINYNQLPLTKIMAELSSPEEGKEIKLVEKLKDSFVTAGFDEVKTYSFYGDKEIQGFTWGAKDHLALLNPINPDQKYLRRHMLPRLLLAASKNLSYFGQVKIYEIGKVFHLKEKGFLEEKLELTALACSKTNALETIQGLFDFFLDSFDISKEQVDFKIDKNIALIKISGVELGKIGLVSQDILKNMKIDAKAAFLRIDPLRLLSCIKQKTFKLISFHPSIIRDISFIISKNISYERIYQKIKENGGSLLFEIELFDTFNDPKRFGKDRWSLAFHLKFQHFSRTLTSEEIEGILRDIRQKLTKEFEAEVRMS